jgi:zinc ribbon protein
MTADQGYRFCPRCGTALVASMPFCPKCGFNSDDIAGPPARPGTETDAATAAFGFDADVDRPMSSARERQPMDRGTRKAPFVIGALVIAAGLVAFGLLSRSQPAANPGAAPQVGPPGVGGPIAPGQSVGPPAPIVGITIQSPQDGAAIATKEVTVIGIAPPGLTVTRDISFGLDQHATADGTGHWAINVGLNEGQNDLVFRIGDDRSTEKRLRVIYMPAPAS